MRRPPTGHINGGASFFIPYPHARIEGAFAVWYTTHAHSSRVISAGSRVINLLRVVWVTC
jgi:hypothetical protein